MSKNKFFNQKVLKMMIKENIENNKSLFLKDNSTTEELIFTEKDYEDISVILDKRLEGKVNISLEDIDIAIDDFLKEKKYIYDYSLEKKYKKTLDGNYFYYGIIELDYYSAETSLEKLIYKVSEIVEKNYTRFCKSVDVFNDIVNINIIKDSSTKFSPDENKSIFKAVLNLKTRNLVFNFNLDEIGKLSK